MEEVKLSEQSKKSFKPWTYLKYLTISSHSTNVYWLVSCDESGNKKHKYAPPSEAYILEVGERK